MTLTDFSIYHWPSQRMVVSILTIALALVGFETKGTAVNNIVTSSVIVFGGLWLFFDALFHVIGISSSNGYKLVGMCRAADRSRPVFLAIVAAGNIFYAANLLFSGTGELSTLIFVHVVHAIVFTCILVVDWYIDNSKKLQKARYKRG